jgi:YggT family protein
MSPLLGAIDSTLGVLRVAFFSAAAVLAVVCGVDWMVRTRRIAPFGAVARFMRSRVDPLLAPVERRVVRVGGLPSSAPWWALITVVVAGIVVLGLLDFVRGQIAYTFSAFQSGPSGIFRLLLTWAFEILQVALIVRVVMSWFPVRPGNWFARWSFTLTEWMLRPLRRIIPSIGIIDITPLVAWFLLSLLEGFFVRLV